MVSKSIQLGKEYDNVNINNVSWDIELVCNIFFAMEMVMDITVQGFIFGQGTYLKDMWGWVNGSSVVISLVLYIPGIKGTNAYTYLQVIKMLRPMRLIYVFPVLKRSLESLVRTLPEVGKQFLNLFIIMVFYGILGLHMFMGALEYRCRLTEEPPTDGSDWQVDENQPYLCGNYECSENTYCKAPFNFDESFNNNERYIGNFNFGKRNWVVIYYIFEIILIQKKN
ncbi:hypothetical protein PPERSA_05022 [Pseudocohnilembus persalinus]|uniref:Ion transport domain-containing protein n=1 Tax=Pseudocohnilembus persalinus TaxID=266149 RepID=A0A0V0QVK9_PSEPJ|nr:hypothetical protein PPERSA_05022 [Pseudocohnilembus persalinus]|eukprot:KRX06409.1 hypothetical protein PPERSA_05022 [Pseudocohnilembus persalinus]